MLGHMTIKRMDRVGIVVDDLEAASAFFVELGAYALGELDLHTEAGLGVQVVDELTEREVVFDPGLTAALLA
jgi:catechol 2,3-dioxygenase-like lactoylglutathione lyase family enzyme